MKSIFTDEDKKNLRRVSRILQSYGMRDGQIELGPYDYVEDFLDEKIGDDLGNFSNNYTIEVPDMVIPILKKIVDYSKKIFHKKVDVHSDADINYCRADIDIDVKDDTISLKIYYSYYETADGQGTTWDESDDEHVTEILRSVSENSDGEKTVTLRYNGSGDSGYIEDRFENGNPVPALVEDWCYRVLENNYGGWEINEGSQGEFNFNLQDKTIDLYHVYNVEESTSITLFEESFR